MVRLLTIRHLPTRIPRIAQNRRRRPQHPRFPLTDEEARDMYAAARAAGIVAMVAFNCRRTPPSSWPGSTSTKQRWAGY
jgi:hypothetical protein